MKIVGDSRDYYDCVQAMGVDRTLLWIRKPVKETWLGDRIHSTGSNSSPFRNPSGLPYFDRMWRGSADHTIGAHYRTQYLVGFCGRIYPVFCFTANDPTWNADLGTAYSYYVAYCYNLSEVDQFVKEHTSKACQANYFEASAGGKRWRRSKWNKPERFYIEQYFELCRTKQEAFYPLFEKHHTPVFLATKEVAGEKGGEIVYNATLRDVEFYRIFDPYRAYQEISMFYNNLAAPDRPIPAISDRDMATAKGFDKWSFRKEPGQPKRRKNK